LREGHHDLGLEGVVRRGQFFEPEAGLAAGIAQFGVRGENLSTFM